MRSLASLRKFKNVARPSKACLSGLLASTDERVRSLMFRDRGTGEVPGVHQADQRTVTTPSA